MTHSTSNPAVSVSIRQRARTGISVALGLVLLAVAAAVLAVPMAVPALLPRALSALDVSALQGGELALPWLRAAQACSAGFCLVLAFASVRRLRAGAHPALLLRTRFDELAPLRGLAHLVHAWLWIAFLASLAASARAAYALYRSYEQSSTLPTERIVLAACLVASVFGLRWLRKGFQAHFVERAKAAAPRVDVSVEKISDGIAASEMASLGVERFPNRVQRWWWLGLSARAGMLTLLWGAAAALTWLHFFESRQASFLAPCIPWLQIALARVLELAHWLAPWRDYAFVAGYVALVIGYLALTHNRNYLLCSFGAQQLVHALTTAVLVVCAALIAQQPGTVVGTAIGALGVWGLRMARDLSLARSEKVRRRAQSPMRQQLDAQAKLLRGVLVDPACRLPEINVGDVERRITQGAENIAEADSLVTRHFGRYMRVGRVRKERCAMALLRYMTVDRHVGLSGGWATYKALGGPSVPLWDEARFPLNVPAGFVDWLDGLTLSADWNVVRTCGPCGGSGWVTETEYYYETEHYTEYVNGQPRSATRQVQRSRQVRKTCSSCNGCGRLEFNQVLYTQWRHMRPSTVQPFVPLPELVDGAEEVCLVRVPLTEDRGAVAHELQSVGFQPELMREVEQAADSARSEHAQLAARACEFLGGRLYRADYSIWAFHTLQVRFARLSRHVGWFFGQRPEFYFPKLPFAWSQLGTTLFLPPLFTAAVALAAAGAWALVTSIAVP
ncbi:MAG: hypothetical protein IT454_15155 [Planctomycetes bacterium]|nr:hypothetical protein [Planctomycetota bacterium]